MLHKDKISKVKEALCSLYQPEGDESCGFISNDLEVILVHNAAQDPSSGFLISGEALQEHGETSFASWHTHPGQDANLSGDDYIAFKNWPNLIHFIIGSDGVRAFQWDKIKKAVVEL